MSVERDSLKSYLADLLSVRTIKDYCPNGLQVEGKQKIQKIVGGVTASSALIDAAIETQADAVLVHHGYFWKGEAPEITGIKKRRLEKLLRHEISLFAYHLPLDLHAEFGNNVQLAKVLDFQNLSALEPDEKTSIALRGTLDSPTSAHAFSRIVSEKLGRECMHIGEPEGEISTIAWCTGAAQGMIEKAIEQGCDAFLSGEISEPTVHLARESGVHYFSAGHHATERYGVKALGTHLAEQFSVDFSFVDIDNPV